MHDKFLKLRNFIGGYGIVAVAVGYVVGQAVMGLFDTYATDVLVPLFINPLFHKDKKTIKIFNQDISFRPLLTKLMIFFITILTLYLLIGVIGRLPEQLGIVH